MDTEYVINLNKMETTAVIECPYCGKSKAYSYGASGKLSSNCSVCKRLVLWDIDEEKAYKASAKSL